jgi:hypothetical protein
MSLIAFLEVTRTKSGIFNTLRMLLPVFLTHRKVNHIDRENQKTCFEQRDILEVDPTSTSSFLPQDANANKRQISDISHLHPFSSFFPSNRTQKYLSLTSPKSTSNHDDACEVVARLPFLASLADTYENVLCHYFLALRRNSDSENSNSILFLDLVTRKRLSILRLMMLRLLHDISKIFERIVRRSKYIWQVRVQISDGESIEQIIELANPENGYYADPFLFKRGKELFLFVEEFSFETSKGVISVFKLTENAFEHLGICLEESFHLSFPNVFVDGTDVFMIPESSANDDIRLYKAHDFPFGWVLTNVMVKNVSAVDTILYKANEMYYLVTGVDMNNVGDHSSNLFIYQSRKLESSTWTPSNQNPVITDAERGRNAGSIQSHSHRSIRVAQASEFGTYGKSIRLFEIQNLSLESYSEVQVSLPKLIVPLDAHGYHHLSSVGNVSAFDFSKFGR